MLLQANNLRILWTEEALLVFPPTSAPLPVDILLILCTSWLFAQDGDAVIRSSRPLPAFGRRRRCRSFGRPATPPPVFKRTQKASRPLFSPVSTRVAPKCAGLSSEHSQNLMLTNHAEKVKENLGRWSSSSPRCRSRRALSQTS